MKKIFGIMSIALITQLMAIPKNFKEISSEGGITIYKSTNNLHYVQKIDLSKGATLKNLLQISKKKEVMVGYGDNKGDKYFLDRLSIQDMWKLAKKKDSKIECISNGEYFAFKTPTTISFPLQVENTIFDGSSPKYLQKYQKILKISESNEVSMKNFNLSKSKETSVLYSNLVEQVEGKYFIIGLDTSYCYSCNNQIGRTFIAIANKDTILIFNSQKATQTFAKETLKSFGATDMIMLDGSGSSQLKCNNQTFVEGNKRLVPHFIATVKGKIKTITYAEKVNFLFDFIEKRYPSFPIGAKTKYQKKGNILYRKYKSKLLYSYNNKLYYYNIDSKKNKLIGNVHTLYNYFK